MAVSILLVEDSARKVKRFTEYLGSRFGKERVEIAVVDNSAAARSALTARQFDILILDISLPLFPGEAARQRAGIDFLREVSLSDDYFLPTYIVGVTSHIDHLQSLREEFEKSAWPLYASDDSSIAWLNRIEALIEHVENASGKEAQKIDVAIVCALYSPELTAVFSLPWNWSQSELIDEATMCRRGHFEVNGKTYTAVATWQQRMGLAASAALATKVISLYRPRILAASGICGGVRGKTQLGDVIFASEAWSWESGKIVSQPRPRTLVPDPHSYQASTLATTLAQEMRSKGQELEAIRKSWTGAPAESPLNMHVGPIASGSAVVADKETVDEICSHSRKTIGIDMEAYALYTASLFGGQPSPVHFCVKAVSDFAEPDKGDSVQEYAAFVSSRVLDFLCRRLCAIV